MNTKSFKSGASFVVSVSVYHVLTYFVAGIIASPLFDYPSLFKMPIIADYYRASGSVAFLLGPFLQIIRGALFGFVLLPFRDFLKAEKLGWLWLWLVYLVIGIVGTPAAAPSSLEGIIYTKIPLWFHCIGLPEIVLQTLAFSFLVHRSLRSNDHPLPDAMKKTVQAFASACISFIGYTIVSIIFALFAGAGISQTSANPRLMGQFIAPLLIIFIITLTGARRILLKHAAMYLASALSFWLYQHFVLGSAGMAYALIAPVVPVLISYAVMRRQKKSGNGAKNEASRRPREKQ